MEDVALHCIHRGCAATFEPKGSRALTIWRARLQRWGVCDEWILCPDHAGRIRRPVPRPDVLEGQLDLWGNEAPPAPAAKPKKTAKQTRHS